MELLVKKFKADVIKMLQEAIMNTLETNKNRISQQRSKKNVKEETTRNTELKQTEQGTINSQMQIAKKLVN